MPLVRVRIFLAEKLLGEPTRPFAAEVSVKAVVDQALKAFNDAELVETVDVFRDTADKVRTAQLPLDSLGGVTVGELVAAGYGTNLVTHVKMLVEDAGDFCSPVADGRPASLPNTMQSMMEREEKGNETVLPPRSTGSYLNHTIFNALLDDLKSLSLGWHFSDAQGSGNALLATLSRALMYALPFDSNGALARRSIRIPDRFKLDNLRVTLPSGKKGTLPSHPTCASPPVSVPPPQRNGSQSVWEGIPPPPPPVVGGGGHGARADAFPVRGRKGFCPPSHPSPPHAMSSRDVPMCKAE